MGGQLPQDPRPQDPRPPNNTIPHDEENSIFLFYLSVMEVMYSIISYLFSIDISYLFSIDNYDKYDGMCLVSIVPIIFGCTNTHSEDIIAMYIFVMGLCAVLPKLSLDYNKWQSISDEWESAKSTKSLTPIRKLGIIVLAMMIFNTYTLNHVNVKVFKQHQKRREPLMQLGLKAPSSFTTDNNELGLNFVRPIIPTTTISKQQLVGKALPKLSTEPLQLLSHPTSSNKIIITTTPRWQPPLPAGILRLRMRQSLHGVHRTLARFLTDDELAEIQHYIIVNNLSADEILRMFGGAEYAVFQVMDLLIVGNRNRVDVLMEPYFQEMDFNAGLSGKQAVRMYTTSYAPQRSGGLISTQLAGYHGAEENDIMDGAAVDEDEGESDSDTQESDNEDEESDGHDSDSNTGEDDGSDEEDYGNEDGDDSEEDDDSKRDHLEDSEYTLDSDLNDAAAEMEIITDAINDASEDFEAVNLDERLESLPQEIHPLFGVGNEVWVRDGSLQDDNVSYHEGTIKEYHPSGFYSITFKSPNNAPAGPFTESDLYQSREDAMANNQSSEYFIPQPLPIAERKKLQSQRFYDINHVPDLDGKKYDQDCKAILDIQKPFYEKLDEYKVKESYTYADGRSKPIFKTPFSCPLNIRDASSDEEDGPLVLALHNYCPDNLRNIIEAVDGGKVYIKNNGRNLHSGDAMRSEDKMVSSTMELSRSGVGSENWQKKTIIGEMNPTAFQYGKTLSDVFEDADEVKKEYQETVLKPVFELAKKSNGRIKILLISSTVRDAVIKMMGGKDAFRDLLDSHKDLFINVAEDPSTKFETMTHPETYYNPVYINPITFSARCHKLSKVMTQFLQHVTQKKSIKSNLGEQILNKAKDSPGYMAVMAAMKALHERNRQRWKDGEASLQLWAVEGLNEMGWEGVDPKEALSFYMKEMYRGGEGSLQLWAVGDCKRLGLGDVDPHQALSILMKHKYKNGQGPLQQWALQKCKDSGVSGIRPEDAMSFYMSDLWKRGENPLQLWVIDECKQLGCEGIRPEDAMSFYMSELWKKGENPLQLWALKKCEELGYHVSAQDAMSFYMSDLWGKGENPLQLYYQKKCQDHGYLIGGEVPSAKEAKDVFQQHESFYSHLSGIQKLAKDKDENFEVLDNNKEVFYPSKSADEKTYGYIHGTLLSLNGDDWRKKKLSEELGLFFDKDSWDKAQPVRFSRRAKEQKLRKDKEKKREPKDEKFTTGEEVNIGNKEEDISNFLNSRQR